MKTATVRDLRNAFPRIAEWIEEGESVEITRNGKRFARLVPTKPESPKQFKMPDIMKRLKEDFGDKVLDWEDLKKGIEISRGDS